MPIIRIPKVNYQGGTIAAQTPYVIYFDGLLSYFGSLGVSEIALVSTGQQATGNNLLTLSKQSTFTANSVIGLGTTGGTFPMVGTGGSIVAATLTSTGGTLTITPGTSAINLDMATTATPTITGLSASGYLTVGSSTYTTGTAAQGSGSTVTGASGASWTSNMQVRPAVCQRMLTSGAGWYHLLVRGVDMLADSRSHLVDESLR